jgi:hypothetical protein
MGWYENNSIIMVANLYSTPTDGSRYNRETMAQTEERRRRLSDASAASKTMMRFG